MRMPRFSGAFFLGTSRHVGAMIRDRRGGDPQFGTNKPVEGSLSVVQTMKPFRISQLSDD
jgi:hypothetical protein